MNAFFFGGGTWYRLGNKRKLSQMLIIELRSERGRVWANLENRCGETGPVCTKVLWLKGAWGVGGTLGQSLWWLETRQWDREAQQKPHLAKVQSLGTRKISPGEVNWTPGIPHLWPRSLQPCASVPFVNWAESLLELIPWWGDHA